jgi:hypothetical protein
MDGGSSEGSEARFAAYVEALGTVLATFQRKNSPSNPTSVVSI